jgi:hypothetical protein
MRILAYAAGIAVGLLGGTLSFAPPAHAVLTLSVNVDGFTVTCRDQLDCDATTGSDVNSEPGTCTALGFWDTGLKPTLPDRAVEAAVCDIRPG